MRRGKVISRVVDPVALSELGVAPMVWAISTRVNVPEKEIACPFNQAI